MNKYFDIAVHSFSDYYQYLVREITDPSWNSYFYWLLGLSLLVWLLEILLPWRKDQKIIRKGFWLDCFYILFNFFLFSLIGYNALSNVGVALFQDLLGMFGVSDIVAIEVQGLPVWSQLLIMFVIADFIQWNIHRQLHRRSWLWEFHKVHHSVKEMGFASQFRFHFMETVIYKSLQYIPLAMIGFGIEQFFVVHMFSTLVGHINHANVGWSYGKLGYIFNSPKMHIWHHARELPGERAEGINFGLSLSLWDHLFRTAYIPGDGKDLKLGFVGDERYPERFKEQLILPFQDLQIKNRFTTKNQQE